jgi:type I restriction enzyme S subunit
MQKIFSQEIRFKNDNGEDFGEWGYLQLGELIEESKAVSKKQDEFDVLTSSRRGLIKQSEYFEGSRLIDRDNVGFNIIKPHEITYRSRSDDGLFYFNFNNLGITGIISTYYPVFSFKNSNNKFVTEYLNFNKADFSKYAVGTSQLVLSLNALRTVKLRIPSKPEQEKIAEFLTAIDERIYHTTAQLTQTKQWKKGLLQQMFV